MKKRIFNLLSLFVFILIIGMFQPSILGSIDEPKTFTNYIINNNFYDPNPGFDDNQNSDHSSSSNSTTDSSNESKEPDVRLSSISVGGFPVKYEYGFYMVTVNPETESVEVMAEGPDHTSVTGVGEKTLQVGKNTIELSVNTIDSGTIIFPLYIMRPDPNKQVNTGLRSLRVVGYEFEFDENTKEYTITVPFDCNEVYIEYETFDNDVTVDGAGAVGLPENTNEFVINVSYGNVATNEYKITIKKSYLSAILIAVIVVLVIVVIVVLVYYFNEKKMNELMIKSAKNKAIADANRAGNPNDSQTFGGKSIIKPVGNVMPTPVQSSKDPAPNQGLPANPVVASGTQPIAQPQPIQQIQPVVQQTAAQMQPVVQSQSAVPMQPGVQQTAAQMQPVIQPQAMENPVIQAVAPVAPVNNEAPAVASTQIASVTPPTAPQVKVIKKIIMPPNAGQPNAVPVAVNPVDNPNNPGNTTGMQ